MSARLSLDSKNQESMDLPYQRILMAGCLGSALSISRKYLPDMRVVPIVTISILASSFKTVLHGQIRHDLRLYLSTICLMFLTRRRDMSQLTLMDTKNTTPPIPETFEQAFRRLNWGAGNPSSQTPSNNDHYIAGTVPAAGWKPTSADFRQLAAMGKTKQTRL